jgi:GT2 family glycosyltransferase
MSAQAVLISISPVRTGRIDGGVMLSVGDPSVSLCFAAVRISHIVVTKGRPDPLRDVLESSIAALSPQDETLVVDGDTAHSGEPVVERILAEHPGVALRYLACDPGMTHQRNVGLDAALGEIVVFTDDDCTFRADMFDALSAVYDDRSVVGATGRVIQARIARLGSDPHSRLRRLLVGGGREGSMTRYGLRRPIVRLDRPRDVEFMPGTLMSARRSVAAEVRFDERLTGYGLGEDDDFSYRLSRRGRLCYEPSVAVEHREIGFRTMDQRARDRRQVINRVYLYRKNFAGGLWTRLGFAMLMAMLVVHRALNREWSGLRGLLDGFREVRHGAADLRGERPVG